MAGEAISSIYTWEILSDELKISLASSEKGAVKVGISLSPGPDWTDTLKNAFPTHRVIEDQEMNRPLIRAVETALKGGVSVDDLPLDIKGTVFQLKTWKTIAGIPYRQTRTYGDVAEMVGKPGGARAIGQAMGKNPLPIVFP